MTHKHNGTNIVWLVWVILGVGSNVEHLLGGPPKPQVNEEEDDAHEEADAAHHNVGDPKEGVLAPQEAGRGDDDGLGPRELGHGVVVFYDEPILLVCRQSCLEVWVLGVLHTPVKLPEVGQRCGPHPHDQIFILETVVCIFIRHRIFCLSPDFNFDFFLFTT